jgi:hypothetical protein
VPWSVERANVRTDPDNLLCAWPTLSTWEEDSMWRRSYLWEPASLPGWLRAGLWMLPTAIIVGIVSTLPARANVFSTFASCKGPFI